MILDCDRARLPPQPTLLAVGADRTAFSGIWGYASVPCFNSSLQVLERDRRRTGSDARCYLCVQNFDLTWRKRATDTHSQLRIWVAAKSAARGGACLNLANE